MECPEVALKQHICDLEDTVVLILRTIKRWPAVLSGHIDKLSPEGWMKQAGTILLTLG